MTNINVRVDEKVKAQAEQVFDALGLTTSVAINVFLRQVVRNNGLPFELKAEIPNKITLEAMAEGEEIAYNKKAKSYKDTKSLWEALNKS